MRIELDAKMFIGSAEQSNSEDADENGASTSGKEEVSSIGVHGNFLNFKYAIGKPSPSSGQRR